MPRNSKFLLGCANSLKKAVLLILVFRPWILVSLSDFSAQAADGTPLWTNIFKRTGTGNDTAACVKVDSEGNVYVTGASVGTGSQSDYATLKYSSNGVAMWTNIFNGTGNSYDSATALAMDGIGNVYVTGTSTSIGTGDDYATLKYSSSGVALWTNLFKGEATGVESKSDIARALVVDAIGNVYVTGVEDYRYATIKYSTNGVAVWTNRFRGTGTSYNSPYSMAVDTNGDVYVTGHASDMWDGMVYATIKYSSTGESLWTDLWAGSYNNINNWNVAQALVVDGNGNVYVTGYATRSFGFDYDYGTIKYSSEGVKLWQKLYNGAKNQTDWATALGVDGAGNVYVTGRSDDDYATIKYSTDGVALWTNLFNVNYDYPKALVVDKSGNVYVTGFPATVKYSTTGVALWTNLFPGSAQAMAVDSNGNVYVTGYAVGSGGDDDYVTIKYSGPAVGVPVLHINGSLGAAVLSWTNATFSLQTAPQANGVFTNLPGATSPYTNPVTGSRQFFRLIGN